MIQPAYIDSQQIYNKRRNFRIKIYLFFGAFFLFLIAALYLIFYSQVFQIRKFDIVGGNGLSNQEILDVLSPVVLDSRLAVLLGINNLLVWNKDKNLDLSKTAILSLNIKRDWLRQSVGIDVREKERLAIWCGTSGCYWIDGAGLVFESAPTTEGSLILTVNSADPAFIGSKIVEERYLNNALAILAAIKNLRWPAKEVVFDKLLQEIRVFTYSGPDFFFSIRFDPKLNLQSLRSLTEKTGLKGIKYVDLRVENKLYYKL